jgi:hypothetical protein
MRTIKGLQGRRGRQRQRRLTRSELLVLVVFVVLGAALSLAAASDPEEALVAAARARGRDLAAHGAWSEGDVRALLALQLVDPVRFAGDGKFRARVLALLPRMLDAAVPPALRDDLLLALNQVPGIDFAASEAVESAWGAVPRRSADRETALPAGVRFDDEAERPLAASIYSLPSSFFGASEADAFLSAVRAAAPRRTLLVLTDLPLRRDLAERARALDVRLLETYGRSYTPWPRDPFTFVRRTDGGLLVLMRPNVQPGREEDANLGRELIQNLPDDLDRAWKRVTWATSPVPFHNGQILPVRDAIWISLHTLEPRILAILGIDRVPVETFGTAEGIDRYVAAARRAAAELAELWGRPARFVHPLPEPGAPLAERVALMRRLGGGAGYDLDSLLTLLPPAPGGDKNEKPAALVADLAAGRRLLAHLPAAEWSALRSGYGLALDGDALAAVLGAAQETPRARGLAGFLDLTAEHLAATGFTVRRLPLVRVPYTLLRDASGLPQPLAPDAGFLITWNNVVAETRDGALRAEGFSSLLPAGDQEAREAFGAAGAHLDLFPPLVRSIILNGGYRCASNHVRSTRR